MSALTSAVNSGLLDRGTGTQLLADLTTIKSLAESLLGQANQGRGSATDPNQVHGVGTFGHDQLNGPTYNPPKHDH